MRWNDILLFLKKACIIAAKLVFELHLTPYLLLNIRVNKAHMLARMLDTWSVHTHSMDSDKCPDQNGNLVVH